MPKRTDIKKVLVIGSGPIVIGQAAEFDYAGTPACLALKEEGYEVILCNSNPATIMTDISIADKVFSVQYHPESAPGPQDSAYLFDRFIETMDKKQTMGSCENETNLAEQKRYMAARPSGLMEEQNNA